ncbi:TlpA family protein disulfide reductase [Aureispira anguillae]|uniref:TlpA family protein disulfide reductase n=1 Tax=Aureispira anguillae TaxID=2864201 RepID=A0A915YBW1_9BACT|nr:TlpA disulfide reductase family protein [Aureispira anguillae]BDS10237.1 TlpA family protein disulfide reductase [Aureispira anguillae]
MRYLLLILFVAVTNFSYAQKNIKTIIEENKFTSLDGKHSSLTEIFKANKGKVIYIDFWASWCGPCKKEMPASVQLHRKLNDEDIVFVYISIDKNEAAWKRSMDNLKITEVGQHYRRNQDEMIEFLKFFYIYSIPHYMIIGKNGQISNRDALPPSNPKVERQLRKLLRAKA